MVTIRELLGSSTNTKPISIKPKKRDDFIESAIIILGKDCPNCKELVESSAFKEFYKAARDRILIAFDEEGYLYGADYSRITDLLERRIGIATPSVALREDVDVLENNPATLLKIAKILGVPFVVKRGGSRSSRSKKSSKTNEFVERKKLKKQVKKAALGCDEEGICREI